MSGSNRPVRGECDLTAPIAAVLLFGIALVVLSTRGGSIAVSRTGLTMSVNAPQ